MPIAPKPTTSLAIARNGLPVVGFKDKSAARKEMRKMKRRTLIALVVVLALAATSSIGWADSPITEKVTGGGHFTSDDGNTVGDLVYLSLVGMEKSGVWSGQGSYRDPAIGFEAHLVIDSNYDVSTPGYVCFEGTAETYINDVFQGTPWFRVCVVDEDADGLADRIGVIIESQSYHYSHMGSSVREYSGCIKIH
jgi:hypothetical protein